MWLFGNEGGVVGVRAPASSRTTVSFGHSDADIIFVGHQVNLDAGGETEISVTVASSVVPNLETACRITLTELAGTTSPLSADASLSALSIDNIDFGSLSSETTEYSYSLGFYGALNGLLTTMTPTTAHSGATWRSNRPDAKTGIDGYQISLNGSQTVTVTVTSQDGAIRRTYTLAPTSSLRRDPTNDVHDVSFANGLWSDGEQFITTKPIDREFALYRVESPQFVEQFEMWAPREFQGWINRKLFSGAVSTWLSKESLWSDGETLWVTYLNNDDVAYAYNLTTRQRDPDRDIALTNRPGRATSQQSCFSGMWSDGKTLWVSTTRGAAAAYDLQTLENLPGLSLSTACGYVVGLWSDGHQVSLTPGTDTTLTITVTAPNGVDTETYTIEITESD